LQSVFVRLLSSRKFVVLCLVLLLTGSFVYAGKATFEQFIDVLKWLAATFLASVAYEDAQQKKANANDAASGAAIDPASPMTWRLP